MAIYKNTASQKIAVFAYDKTTGLPKTGDAANITAYISKDWGAAAAVTDTNPTELDSTNMAGWYVFDLTQAETNAEVLVIAPKSATANILLEQVQVVTADSTVATAAALATVDSNVDAILDDTGTTLPATLQTIDDFLDTEIAAILEDTGTTLPNQIAGLNNLSAAQVNAEVDTALADYDAPTKAELDAGLAGLNDLDATEVQTAAAAALTAYDPPTKAELDAADDAVLAAIALLNNLSSAGAQAAAAAALAAYDAATGTDVTSATSGLSTFDATTDAVTVGTIQADAITAGAIATAAAQEIADAVLSRGVGNVEATADEHSLTAIVLAALESAIVGTDWTIYRTDGATTFTTKTVTVDASADPITAVE